MRPVILIIENAIDITGSVKSILRSCLSLSADFEFRFVVSRNSNAVHYLRNQGFYVYELPMLEIRKSFSLLLYLPMLSINLFRLRKIIRESEAKLVVTNDFYNMLPPLYKLGGGVIPYITFVRFIPSRFPPMLVNFWCACHYRFATRIIAVSMAVLKDLKKGPKVTMVYNELPIEDGFNYYPYDVASKTILFVSNYIPGKGLEFAIRALAGINGKFKDWRLRFVGGDMGLAKNRMYRESLKRLAVQLNVDDRIDWMGFSSKLVDEYRQAALLVNFSESESFSLTCVEAMYIGRPVIATRCGGPQEIITPGYDGELVDVGDVAGMVAGLESLLADGDRRKKMGENAHFSVADKFSLQKTAYRLKPIYLESIFHT